MAEIVEFPYENTKEWRDMMADADDWADKNYADQYVRQSIIGNVAHVAEAGFDFTDEETMKFVALIGRVHRSIALWQMGHKDPLVPFLLRLCKDLDLQKIEIIDK